ncbi:hypothetical protein BaRGS_00026055 [Batillaria attramentaria]|uniref:Phorbol-ester/DAG-type domain-containing protein n=1 Tax=Batillaria attramentaria TaxID=370345 RepID=A0ABD0K6M6_9CAEN
MLCGLSRRLSKSFSRRERSETKTKKEKVSKKRFRRRSLDDSMEIMADFSSATIYDDDQGSEQGQTSHTEMMSGQHNWYACSHARPTYCNVCREALSGVTSHGLSCEGKLEGDKNNTERTERTLELREEMGMMDQTAKLIPRRTLWHPVWMGVIWFCPTFSPSDRVCDL